MMNMLMNDTVVWGLVGLGVLLLAWMWWPKKTVTETLEEVKAEEAAPPAPVEATAPVAPVVKKRAAPKKPATPKVASKKAPAKTTKKAAPKKAAVKGRK
jgi:outer membrane biosynthesis protein TonB